MPVAVAAVATMSNDCAFFVMRKVGNNFTVALDDRTDWNFYDKIFAGFARRFLARNYSIEKLSLLK